MNNTTHNMPVRTPFVTVTLIAEDGSFIDLTDYVDSLALDRCVKKDDSLEIRFKYDYSMELMDDPEFVQGAEVRVQYGYIGWRMSSTKSYFITDIDPEYTTNVELNVKCSDKGVGMKKYGSGFIWKNITISDIAARIAIRHKLTAVIDETKKVYASIPQGQQPDYAFLKYLATLAGQDYQAYVTEAQLYFIKRDLLKESVITYEYGMYEIISFSPRWDEKAASSATGSVTSVGFDKANMQALAGHSDNDSNSDAILGDAVSFLFNGDKVDTSNKEVSDQMPKDVAAVIDKASKVMISPSGDKDELTNSSKSVVAEAKLSVITGDLVVQGNPLIAVGDIITLSGFAYCHNGNWYVESVRDDVSSGGGYITTIHLKKNAFMRRRGGKAQKNKTVGTGEQTKEVKEVYFDLNGNKI